MESNKNISLVHLNVRSCLNNRNALEFLINKE